jgi:hypothetical protein
MQQTTHPKMSFAGQTEIGAMMEVRERYCQGLPIIGCLFKIKNRIHIPGYAFKRLGSPD